MGVIENRLLLFDTNILIDSLLGDARATELLTRADDRPVISLVSWIEVMAGVKGDEEQQTRRFLADMDVVAIDAECAERAAMLRRRNLQLKLPDAVILATAQLHSRVLVTRNTKDFLLGSTGVWVPYQR